MKILITGAAGFIGSNLAQFFLNKKDDVFAIDNFFTSSEKNLTPFKNNHHFHFYEDDVLKFNFSSLPKMDLIYHLASPASPLQYKKYPIETLMVNSLGTKRVLDFMKQTKSKIFVLASTSEVYGDPEVHPQKENYWGNVNPVGTRSCYDEGKRFAEALTMVYFRRDKLDVRIARIFNTYGQNMEKDDGRVISNFIYQSLSKQPITVYGDGSQTRSFCFVSDMVEALYLLGRVKNLAGQIINLGNPDERKIIDIAKLIKKMLKTPSPITFLPNNDYNDPKKRKPDIARAKQMLNWQPQVKFEEGLKETINYFRTRFF